MTTDPLQPGAPERCWRTIGVHGDRSCPQLAAHVHCRHCPVFAAAAAQLLEREPPAESLAEWSRLVAQPPPEARSATVSLVIFRIGAEWLALPTAAFEEILGPRPVHTLPHRRGGAVLGLANVRGELLACLSLRRILGIGEAAEPEAGRGAAQKRLLVLAHRGSRAACPVDEVEGVHRCDPRALIDPPASLARSAAAYTRKVLRRGERAIGLLDETPLFHTIARSLSSATLT